MLHCFFGHQAAMHFGGTLDDLVFAVLLDNEGQLQARSRSDSQLDGPTRERLEHAAASWNEPESDDDPGSKARTLDTLSLTVQRYAMERPNGEPAGVLSLVVNARAQERMQSALSRRIEFERLISDLSTRFIDLGEQLVDDNIHHALKSIGEFAQVDRAYIFLFSPDGTTMSNTHEWCAEGITPEIEGLQRLPVEDFPWWCARIKQRQAIHIPRVEDMGQEAIAEKNILMAQDIRSVVVVPLFYARKVEGYLGFDAVRSEKEWSHEDIALLTIVGEMFMNALQRHKAEEERRSLVDQIVAARSLENVAKLAGGVAHDFNNLLGIILNCATAISSGLKGTKHERYTDDLLTATKQAATLTRQLLIIGRRNIVEPSVLRPNQVLRDLCHLIEHTLGEGVECSMQLDETIACVRLGRTQLEQIIVNLAMNARDAMPHGGRLFIMTKSVVLGEADTSNRIDVRPGGHVCLSVRDTGTGMTAEVLSRALEPFYTTKRPQGTGLGLSTVHSIVTEANGHIRLSSSPGNGTTVAIYLPVCEAEGTSNPAVRRTEPNGTGRGETILVVEDCEELRQLVSEALIDNGYRVLAAANAARALDLCAETTRSIDLILTDVIMPGMSGREMAALAVERLGIQRVAYMSGYEDEVLTQHRILEPGIRLIQKPFLVEELLRFVRDALDQ
jgi:signal transduction histidine kinase